MTDAGERCGRGSDRFGEKAARPARTVGAA